MSQIDQLFPADIIPRKCHEQLGADLTLRPLLSSDHARGHLELLSVLTVAPRLSQQDYEDVQSAKILPEYVFYHRDSGQAERSNKSPLYLSSHSAQADKQIVACGSIIIERKFLRNAGLVGHIEDIAVSKSMQGRKLGLKIINTLEEIGRVQGVYKIILDCSQDNIPFYEKCGFTHKEYEMVRYIEGPQASRVTSKL